MTMERIAQPLEPQRDTAVSHEDKCEGGFKVCSVARHDPCYAPIGKTTYRYTASSTQLTPEFSSKIQSIATERAIQKTTALEKSKENRGQRDSATEHAVEKITATKRIWLLNYLVFFADGQCFLVCIKAWEKLRWT